MSSVQWSGARTRRIIWGVVILFLVALVAATVWVGARSLLAKNELEATVPLAEKVKAALIAGDQSATGASIVELANHARAASALTSDPIYAIAQSVPFVGPNLTAFRQVTVTIDHIIGTGLLPLASLAVTFEAGTLGPVDGAFQVQPLIDAAPTLETADRIMREAQRDLAAIDTSATIGAVTDAVARVDSVVNNAAVSVATASNVATLLPAMLGTTEDRTYLLMFQNNAEVRATGGLPGALAIVNTSKGRFSLGEQSSATKFPHYPAPVLPLDRATASLHPEVGQFMQDVNETPDFPTAAALAREMWRREKGVSVDGVISIDPVALSYILKATGPVTVSTGDVLDSKTVVDFLLSGVYAKYPDPVTQDSVFADAAQAVFSAIATGSLDQGELRDALAKASSERRILIWNTREAEQKVLAGTHFAGTLPKTNAGGDLIGVYLNDASGAKMDYYLDAATTVTSGADPGSYRADVAVSSSAPADAATSLSAYVTGGGVYGVPPGSVRTRVLVYGPVGSHVTATRLNGVPVEAQVEQDFGRGVAQVIVQLAPGEVATVSVDLEGASSPSSGEAAVRMTPLIREGKVIINAPTEP